MMLDLEAATKTLKTCPRCGGSEETHAFNLISDPVEPEDGTYAVCPKCDVYWKLSTNWPLWRDMDMKTAMTISNTIRKACTRVKGPFG